MGVGEPGLADGYMGGVKRMSGGDLTRTIESVTALDLGRLRVAWSDNTAADIDVSASLARKAFAPLLDPAEFATVQVGDWGHSVEWRCGIDLGADALWLETLTAAGRNDVRLFLEWRLRNGLSLSKAAEALGLARRTVAYYSNGDRSIPKAILLACTGWEVSTGLQRAA